MRKQLLLPVLMLAASAMLRAQSVYLDPSHEAYDFLKRMEAKQIITGYRDAVKPMTRGEIARFLPVIARHAGELTAVEREQLAFYREEFYLELKQGQDTLHLPEERWHLYRYRSEPGVFNVDLNGGYSYQRFGDGTITRTRSNGAQAYGYIGGFTGTYVYFRDNHEEGTRLTAVKPFTPEKSGVVSRALGTYLEYDQFDAQLVLDASFLRISLEKMPNRWGAGEHGNVILSEKAPSYPQIKLRARLGKDIDFTYLHAWLSSDVVDSLRTYHSGLPGSLGIRTVYMQKYLAAQMLEVSPWDGVDLAIGESEVYGGRNPELLYLIPVMFFKAAEHYSGDTDNSQFFFSVDITALKGYDLYASMFIDEFSTEEFYMSNRQRNQLAFTVGATAFDLLLPDLDVNVEYTRCNPWVYNHKFPDVTFQSHSIDLGHWMGQNADYFFLGGKYRPIRELQLGLQVESMRKGGKKPTEFQYQLPTPSFLYGPLWKSQAFGLTARYEPLRDLFIDMHVLRSRYTSEAAPSSDYAGKTDVLVGVRYNFH
ncbi:MAG: capsule assembly Wzi family protein [Acidobacteriota bacterium]